MACGGKELVSLFLCKICNPRRSDYNIEEQVDELKTEAELERLKTLLHEEEAEVKRLRAISEVEEMKAAAELKRLETLLHKEEAEVKRLRSILEDNSGPSEEEEKKNEIANANEVFFLPSDLVLLILSRLALKDNIRSSAVCKTWGEIAASVRVRDRPCWLMYLDPSDIKGVSYGFFDPLEKKKTKDMILPELSKSSCIVCSKDGWLLMTESDDRIFFFNPFTRERINLPSFRSMIMENSFAFSCAPTKKGCLVFGIELCFSGRAVTISTWHPGASTWVYKDFPSQFQSHVRDARSVLHSDGLFYMASEIALGVYDPSLDTWNERLVQLFPRPNPERHTLRWMTEYKGQKFLVDASSLEPIVFRLNRLESVWEKKEILDGSSIFVSDGSCVMTSGLTGSMSNIVYIWNSYINQRRPTKYQCSFKRNRPYKYSLYSKSLCEDPEGYHFEYRRRTQQDGVWIEPPHNISISDFAILDPSEAINTSLFI